MSALGRLCEAVARPSGKDRTDRAVWWKQYNLHEGPPNRCVILEPADLLRTRQGPQESIDMYLYIRGV